MFDMWWQKITQHWVAIGLIAIGLVVFIALIIAGYWINWTGFDGYIKETTARILSGTNTGTVIRTEEYQREKKLWDWLQLLVIPLMLVIVGIWFNKNQKDRDVRATEQRDKTEREIAADNQRETALQAYLDKMSELLLKEKLRDSAEDDEVRKIARVRTLTVLRGLDPTRKASVIQFLHESGLIAARLWIDKDKGIISLSGANLSRSDLSRSDLSGADLSEANLSEADLSKADLSGADFIGSDLRGANLSRSNLSVANLFRASLSGADLSGSYLSGAYLSESDLSGANLSRADLSGAGVIGSDLSGANLSRSNLRGADLSGSYLSKADLSKADLEDAFIIIEELEKQAKSLQDATMPDGSKHP